MSGGGLGAAVPYQKFVHFALEETRLRTTLTPHPSQEKFKIIKANDDNTDFSALSFSAPKIRLLRSLTIEKKNSVQEDDPLYFDADAYAEEMQVLPWGGKITSESLRFFSPIVIWTIFESTERNHNVLLSAFMDYYKVWVELVDEAIKENNKATIARNREQQHKYLTWRAEKDPGYPLLKKLIGESGAKDLVMEFLFEGVNSLGTKSFLDYFPEYARDDGSINKKRSVMGKSFESRPWDANGEFIGNAEAQ
ncbi:hypothetical protein ABZP36_015160 [Zizania latifolia]